MSSLAGALYSALNGVCAEERMNLFKFEDSNWQKKAILK